MKNLLAKYPGRWAGVMLLMLAAVALAADMTFPTYVPQTTDDLPVLARRQAAAIASLTTGVGTPTVVSSMAYETSHVLKNSAGTLVWLTGYNSKASAQFIQVFNSATVPADTAVPIATLTAAASSNFSVPIPAAGLPLATGIAVSNSSTGPTKTIGSADVFFTAVVK